MLVFTGIIGLLVAGAAFAGLGSLMDTDAANDSDADNDTAADDASTPDNSATDQPDLLIQALAPEPVAATPQDAGVLSAMSRPDVASDDGTQDGDLATAPDAPDTTADTGQPLVLTGSAGDEILAGQAGEDMIDGAAGDDQIGGRDGADEQPSGPQLESRRHATIQARRPDGAEAPPVGPPPAVPRVIQGGR